MMALCCVRGGRGGGHHGEEGGDISSSILDRVINLEEQQRIAATQLEDRLQGVTARVTTNMMTLRGDVGQLRASLLETQG